MVSSDECYPYMLVNQEIGFSMLLGRANSTYPGRDLIFKILLCLFIQVWLEIPIGPIPCSFMSVFADIESLFF